MDRLCRLCWKVINDDNFEIIEEIRKEMLEVLLLKLDLSWSVQNIMCSHCIEELEKSFQFKATCLYTEDHIFPLIKQNDKIDMRQIYNDDVISIAADEDVCRLCMGVFENDTFNALEAVNRDTLQECIPEVNLKVAQRTLICKGCLTSLTCYFNFARICMETDKKVRTVFKNRSITNNCYVQLSRIELFTDGNTNKSSGVKVEGLQNIEDGNNSENGIKMSIPNSYTKEYEFETNKTSRIKQRSNLNTKKSAKSKEKFSCEICSRSCSTKYVLVNHKLSVHGEGLPLRPYECDQCSFRSKYKVSFMRHALVHKSYSETKEYKCNKCQFQTIYKNNLKVHSLIHQQHPVLYRCEHCPYKSKYRDGVSKHMLTHKSSSEVKMFKCNVCTFKSKWRDALRRHEMIHKSKSELTTFNCSQCPYKATQKIYLKRHMNTHKKLDERILYKCNICGRRFKGKDGLTRHTLLHKDLSEVKLHCCEKCTFTTRHRSSLRTHMLTHMDSSQLNMYKCEICPYQSKLSYKIKRHSLIHQKAPRVKQGPTIHECTHCSYKATEKRRLKIHLNIMHNDKSLGELPILKCMICSYQTRREHSFRYHVQTHKGRSNTELYQCETCGGKFNKGYVKVHQRTCVGSKAT